MSQVHDDLKRLLADTYVLMAKTHAYHWNVTGPTFGQLHDLFQDQYEELFEAADMVAERLRALDVVAPGGLKTLAQMSGLTDATEGQPGPETMLATLRDDHAAISSFLKGAIERAGKAGDPATEDMFTERLRAHDQAAWMLRATKGKS